jgi:hypothetical protein
MKNLEGLEPKFKTLLQDWIRKTPRTNSRISNADHEVGKSIKGKFFDEIDIEIKNRGEAYQLLFLGDSYEDALDETFSKLAELAKTVSIYDTYAYKLFEGDKGRFLQSLLKIPNLELNIFTDFDKDDRSSLDKHKRVEKVIQSWRDFLELHRDQLTHSSTARLHLYHPTTRIQHDRVIIFSFSSNRVAMPILAGIEEFDQERVISPKVIADIQNPKWIDQLKSVWATAPRWQKAGQTLWVGSKLVDKIR